MTFMFRRLCMVAAILDKELDAGKRVLDGWLLEEKDADPRRDSDRIRPKGSSRSDAPDQIGAAAFETAQSGRKASSQWRQRVAQ